MFLKNRNISSKIKRSKVTNYAALSQRFITDFVRNFVRRGLKQYVLFNGMLLTRTHKANKNQWVSRHIGQQQRHWRYKMFSNTRSRFPLFYPCAIIKIDHECEGGIEKIVPWIHSLSSPDGSQLITNAQSDGPIFS